MSKTAYIVVGVIIVLGVVWIARDRFVQFLFRPTSTTTEQETVSAEAKEPEVVVSGLMIPWELVFLPGGDMLVTERPGRLLRIGQDEVSIPVSGVAHRGEGGLLGLALHPKFSENGWIYLYMTTEASGGLRNRVERYKLDGTNLSERKVIIDDIPGAANHDGGRLAFGPDGFLYISTGDAGQEDLAQDRSSLAGKVLRLREDGSVPTDNPFGNAVYSYGHRNVQGFAWDDQGQLWATEHGRSGIQSGFDEVNKIMRAGNYGWPAIQGDETREGMIAPEMHSGGDETWAPSGAVYLQDKFLFAGLRGQSLYEVDISTGEARNLVARLREKFGRLRTLTIGPDGMLYILTNNRDGRGTPETSDDRIIRVSF